MKWNLRTVLLNRFMQSHTHLDTGSYRSLIDSFIYSIGVCRSEIKNFRYQLHKLLALFGIITFASLNEERKKPYKNSPFGKYINYVVENGKRKYVRSFILNQEGIQKTQEILNTYAADPWLYKDELKHMKMARKYMQSEIDGNVLRHWLKANNIKFDARENYTAFKYDNKWFSHYYESNIIVGPEKKTEKPFWFIVNSMSMPNKESIAKACEEVFQAHYELKFLGETNVWMTTTVQTRAKSIYEVELENRIEALEKALLKCADKPKGKEKEYLDPYQIKETIREFVEPLPKRPYLMSVEEYGESFSIHINERLEKAYKYLEARNLIDAVNAPEWKYNFDEDSIDILARIDKRASAVFDVRHRLLEPVTLADGTIMKEKAEKEEGKKKFKIPFGLERIDYRFKVIFVVEGFFDSCFIKNAVAITTCIMPKDMRKVIDIYRQNGFQIVHIPDNFRAGDKGGKAALREYLKTHSDVFHEGDLVFDWSIWPEQKDINDVAVAHDMKEVPTTEILKHCWDKTTIWNGLEFID